MYYFKRFANNPSSHMGNTFLDDPLNIASIVLMFFVSKGFKFDPYVYCKKGS